MNGDFSYLLKDFDPTSLKIPDIKRLLVFHEINFPSSSKKKQLVEIFKAEITKNSEKLLASYDYGPENSIVDADKTKLEPLQKRTRSKSPVKKTDVKSKTPKNSKVQVKSKSVVKEESKVTKPTRKTRQTQPKEDTPSPKIVKEDSDEAKSPFSKENSFQKTGSKKRKRPAEEDKNYQERKTKKSKDIFDVSSSDSEDFDLQNLISKNLKDSKLILESPKKEYEKVYSPASKKTILPEKPTTPLKKDSSSKKKSASGSTTKKSSKISTKLETVKSPLSKEFKKSDSEKTTPKLKLQEYNPDELAKSLGIVVQGKRPTTFDRNNTIVFELASVPKKFKKSNVPEVTLEEIKLKYENPELPEDIFDTSSEEENEMLSDLEDEDSVFELKEGDSSREQSNSGSSSSSDEQSDSSVEAEQSENSLEAEQLEKSIETALDKVTSEIEEENALEEELRTKQKDLTFSFGSYLKYFLVFASLSLLGLYALWFKEQRLLIGYCGMSIEQNTFPNPNNSPYIAQAEEYLKLLQPKCIECPDHATCFPYFDLRCHDDFLEITPYTYYVSGKKCIPDLRKQRRIETMVKLSLSVLRQRNAAINCGKGHDEQAGLAADELYSILLELKSPEIGIEEFDEVWQKAEEYLEADDEIFTFYTEISSSKSAHDGNSQIQVQKKVFRSTSLANLNVWCRVQKIINFFLKKYKLYISGLILAVLSVFTIYHKIKSDRARKAEVNRICQIVIEKLQAQKKQFIYDSTGQAKPYLGSIQLRDVLLKGNTNKLKTWKIVANRVESNSNVQTVALEVYGEIMRTWEWIGSVDEF